MNRNTDKILLTFFTVLYIVMSESKDSELLDSQFYSYYAV